MGAYTSFTIEVSSENLELINYHLDLLGFEGIIEISDTEIETFISDEKFYDSNILFQIEKLSSELDFNFILKSLEERNWNSEWESSFEPVEIGNKLRIRAPFHYPSENIEIDLIVEPKMSFGTGHHSTTYLMAESMLNMNIKDQKVLDAGSGTGILAILAEKLGAGEVIGFDVEEWAFRNSLENAELNNCTKASFYFDNALGLPFGVKHYDLILANITKNILKEDIPVYLNYLRPKGTLLISGFFQSDVNEMIEFVKPFGLEVVEIKEKNSWANIQLSF